MTVERELREQLDATARRIPAPPDRLDEVIARGRRRARRHRTAVLAAVALLGVVVVVPGLDRATVEFAPGDRPGVDPRPAPDTDVTASPEPVATVAPGDLRAPVLAYGPGDHDPLLLIDRDGERVVYGGPVDAAFPDGAGGVVLQPASLGEVLWLPSTEEAATAVRLVETREQLTLRGMLPDGRVLFSLRPPGERVQESDAEEFFAVAREAGARPEPVGTAPALESSRVGPAVAAGGQPIHAACHLHCALRPGLADAPSGSEAIYDGLAIEGLTATPDGRVVAFVEFDAVQPSPLRPPQLVLLDGSSFSEYARVDLPAEDGAPTSATVSLSADAHRVLVALGHGTAPPAVPTTPYLVEGALDATPLLRRVDASGALRWTDPVAASGPGGPATAAERDAAERLITFAGDPGPASFAEVPLASRVTLGLGPQLLAGTVRDAGDLAEPEAWRLDPEELFRAAVGPFSALDRLAEGRPVRISAGPHAHCASPPLPRPAELAGLRQVSIQPATIESCLQWWSVDLYLDDGDRIAGVVLDVWEP